MSRKVRRSKRKARLLVHTDMFSKQEIVITKPYIPICEVCTVLPWKICNKPCPGNFSYISEFDDDIALKSLDLR